MKDADHLISATLLAGVAMLGIGEAAIARPHELPPKGRDLSRPTADMDAWLRRLQGRFRYEGTLVRPGNPIVSVQGLGDCIGIGTGPGVHCIINLRWPTWSLAQDPVFVGNLDPAMILYGVAPNITGMTYLQVNQKGLAEGGHGSISGDTATFSVPCVNTGSNRTQGLVARSSGSPTAGDAASPTAATGVNDTDTTSSPNLSGDADLFGACQRTTRIEARPERQLVYVWIDIGDRMEPTYSFVLSLRRVPQGESGDESPARETQR